MKNAGLFLENTLGDAATFAIGIAEEQRVVIKSFLVSDDGELQVLKVSFELPDNVTSIGRKTGYPSYAEEAHFEYFGTNVGTADVSVSFTNITYVAYCELHNMFYNCAELKGEVNFPKLENADQGSFDSAFENCTGITTISFPALTSMAYGAWNSTFYGCTGIKGSVSFPAVKTVSYGALSDMLPTTVTEVHFRKDLSDGMGISASRLGCIGATIYYDL